MSDRAFRPSLAGGALSLLALLAGACQDYAFEELPSSVIREKRIVQNISVATDIDILFVIDNSGSMVGEQVQLAQSFSSLTDILDAEFGAEKYQIAVITTGMESPGCPECQPGITQSCMNETGENGRFQSRVGRITDLSTDPITFVFDPPDPNCRIVTSANKTCFYDAAGGGIYGSGIAFVGTNGCGYEKGLEPIRVALSDLAGTTSAGFLRNDATLAIIVVSDEDDCGKVGDVTENISGIGGQVCYYASKGQGPDGSVVDPQAGLSYRLTPVQEYYDFLMGLKGDRSGMVKFAAVVGVTDEVNPGATEITFDGTQSNSKVLEACSTPGCVPSLPSDTSCKAYPGTRYVELAQLFGLQEGGNGMVGTICKDNFSQLMADIGEFVTCPKFFKLSEQLLDPALANILLNNVEVPRYSCTVTGRIEECSGVGAAGCTEGSCVETWHYYHPGDAGNPFPASPGGVIEFAAHYQPCDLITEGQMLFEVVYVTP
ncbi:MAG TPA: VWA domain-containing protein [Myxococcota bacterium]|nr:VWA domain-containing protein [Myxococcota bacterium]HRY93869.1 VWA domain-containing protein [Myxococcota bacterium]